jgi:hypothetical protein
MIVMEDCAFDYVLDPCRSDYSKPLDNSSGARQKNGSWSGVTGMMVRGEVQVSNIPFVMTPERQSAMDFTFPLIDTRYE